MGNRFLVFALLGVAAVAQPPAEWNRVLAQVSKYEYGQSREPLMQLNALVRAAGKSPQGFAAAEKALDAVLKSDATREGKNAVCLELSLIGTDASVPPLAGLLADDATAEAARYALERIGTADAVAALRAALGPAGTTTKLGIVNALGAKRDHAAVPALAALLAGSDAAIVPAAADALAKIADAPSRAALTAALEKSTGAQHQHFAEAFLACADVLIGEGRNPEALAIYTALYQPRESAMVRVSALRGIAAVRGAAALPLLSKALREGDAPTRAIAVRAMASIPEPAAANALTDDWAQLPLPAKVQVSAALADRGDPGARSMLAGLTTSQDPELRLAAIEGLSKVGESLTIILLARVAAKTTGSEQDAARLSLYRLNAPDADSAVIRGIGDADIPVRLELIRAAGERNLKSAVDALLAATRDANPQVRLQSIRALRPLTGPQQVPALIEVLVNAQSSEARTEAQRTLAAAVGLDRQAAPALTKAFQTVDPAVKQALLLVMAQSGNPDTLPHFRETLSAGSDELRRGAIVALSQWPSAAPSAELLAQAGSATNPAHRILALRGYIKLVALPSGRTPAETAKLLAAAQPLATQPEEKRAILAALQRTPAPESLALAESQLNDPTVASEAAAAVAALKRTLNRQ